MSATIAPRAPGYAGCVLTTSTTEAEIDCTSYVGQDLSLVSDVDCYVMMGESGDTIARTTGTTLASGRGKLLKAGVPYEQTITVKLDRPFLIVKTVTGSGTLDVHVA